MDIDFKPDPQFDGIDFTPDSDVIDFKPDRDGASILRAAPEESWVQRAYQSAREGLSPLLGPTEAQREQESVTLSDGTRAYKPLGSAVDQEGFFPALSKPFIALPRAQGNPEDSTAKAIGKGVYNTAAGFLEFMESPLGAATGGLGKVGPLASKLVAGAFSGDMATKVPEVARAAGEASVTGTPQEKTEAYLGLGAQTLLPALLASHVGKPNLPQPEPQFIHSSKDTFSVPDKLGDVSEFGGLTESPIDFIPDENKPIAPAGAESNANRPASESSAQPGSANQRAEAPTGDLFGSTQSGEIPQAAPVKPPTMLAPEKFAVVEVPIKELKLSKDVPNFKMDADKETGVVEGQELAGSYERLGTGAVTVYERSNGAKEVISGRHRFDLARRTGETTIPSQIVRESEGFTPQMARILDAEMNIRDGQGTVADFANYFRNTEITPDQAQARGLLIRKGQAGWEIGKNASEDVYSLFRSGKLNESQTAAIAASAPGDAPMQRVGSLAALDGAGAQEIRNFIQAIRAETKGSTAEQFDLFGNNDAALNTARELARVATRIQGELGREIRATDNAAKAAVTARAKGISFDRPPEEILAENATMKDEQTRWENWALHPDLVAQVRGYAELKRATPEMKSSNGLVSKTPLETWANGKIKAASGRLSAGLDPELLAAYTVKGAALMERGIRSFQDWSREMLSQYGPKIEPFMKSLWQRSSGILSERLKKWVGKRLRDIGESFPADLESPDLMDVRQSNQGILNQSARVFESWPKRLIAADGSDILLHNPEGGRVSRRTAHLIFDNSVKRIDLAKAAWLPMVPETLKNAAVRLIDAKNENRVFVRAYGDGTKHVVIVNPAGVVEFQKPFKGGLITQFAETKHETPRSYMKVDWVRGGENGTGRSQGNPSPTPDGSTHPDARHPEFQPQNTPSRFNVKSVDERLQGLKIDTTGKLYGGLEGVPVAVWNGSIDAVRLALKAGKSLADALEEGLTWLKAHHSGPVDEAAYRAQVGEELGVREFGRKVLSDPAISPDVKTRVSEYTYEPRSNQTDLKTAQDIVGKYGLDGAIGAFKDGENAMPGAVRSGLGKFLIKHLADQERVARATGDTATSDAMAGRQVDMIDYELKRSTDIAQSLQAMRLYGDMSATALVRHARRTFDAAGNVVMQTLGPALENVKSILQAGNEQAIEGVRHDPEVNRAAREAVNEHVATSPETHQAIIMELAEPFAQSPTILAHAREAVREKVNQLLNGSSPFPRPAEHLRAMLDDMAKRAASIAAGHFAGAEPGIILRDKLIQRLGISQEHATRLAKALDAEFTKMVESAKKRIPQRVANQRAKQLQPYNPLDLSDAAVDREIRRQLKETNVKLGNLVQEHGRTVDAAGASLAERVVRDSEFKGASADKLREVFHRRFEAIATARKRAALEQLNRSPAAPPRKVKSMYEKLIAWSNLGAFGDAKYWQEVKRKLEIPEMSEALAKEITRKANDVQAKPEGFQRQRAALELMDLIGKQKANWYDLPFAFWYANILSGPTTHLANTIGNVSNFAAHMGLQMARQPLATPHILAATARGLRKGGLEAAAVLKTGYVTGTRLTKFESSRPLELTKFEGFMAPLNAWKYVTRALSAEDLLFFKAGEEVKASVAARMVAKREGLTGPALTQRVANILGNVEARVIAAKAQAVREGLKGLDAKRRVNEILEQSRPDQMKETAREFGLRVTFNNDPYGLIGVLAKGINWINHEAVVTRFVMPFTNIVANVVNEGLNYLPPVGAARAIWGHWKGTLEGKPITDREMLYDQWAKAAMGTALMTGVALAATSQLEEEDPQFMISGAGPRTKTQRDQLKATGWIPFSIKVGNRYYSFANTAAAIPFAIVGNYIDAIRYKHLGQTAALNRVAYAIQQSGNVVLQQSFLDSAAKMMEMANRDSTQKSGAMAVDQLARSASSFVVPNALKQVDRMFDPTVYDSADVEAALIAQVPFVRRLNRPALNVFGAPVTASVLDRFTNDQLRDPLLRVLAQKHAWVTVVPDDVMVGNKKLGEDFYRALTPDERYDYVRETGQAIRDRLEMSIDKIADMDPDQAKAFVQKVADKERAAVRAKMR